MAWFIFYASWMVHWCVCLKWCNWSSSTHAHCPPYGHDFVHLRTFCHFSAKWISLTLLIRFAFTSIYLILQDYKTHYAIATHIPQKRKKVLDKNILSPHSKRFLGCIPSGGGSRPSVWCLHILTVSAWVFPGAQILSHNQKTLRYWGGN